MKIEYEAKFYIDPEFFKKSVKNQGGQLVQPLNLMKRWIFKQKDVGSSWVRVRDEGDKVMITYKSFDGSNTIESVKELELEVSDFDKMCQMLELLGLSKVRYVENMRETWQLADCFLMIDHWPALEPFVEIEGPSKKSVETVCQQLGLQIQEAVYGPTARLYEQEYGITQKEFDEIKEVTFEKIPSAFRK